MGKNKQKKDAAVDSVVDSTPVDENLTSLEERKVDEEIMQRVDEASADLDKDITEEEEEEQKVPAP
jgi:hypothetical protein